MWSRIRHRRFQALSLLSLAALLTTCLCLGPLYQRAMEQGLAGSVLTQATPEQTSVRLDSSDLSAEELERLFPARLDPYFSDPDVSLAAPVKVVLPDGSFSVVTRLYAADGACERLEVASGRCPTGSGEVMVSTADIETNGWTVGSQVDVTERVDPNVSDEVASGTVTVVGVYEVPPADGDWLDAPLTGRAGTVVPEVGTATDDWVTAPDSLTAADAPAQWHKITSSTLWTLDLDAVDHDSLLVIGPIVDELRQEALQGNSAAVLLLTDLPGLSERVASGSEQGRTTVVVLISQLLVLVSVVLWMVLVGATDDRRAELALARLRGRGRRGAAAYLLSELLPLTLGGVAVGVLVSPFVMALVAKIVFPVPVPIEVTGGFVLAALAAVAAVLAVVLLAARRAVREPVDSLLRAVPARHTATGTGVIEIATIVFSLTAVAALVSGRLEGPLATLAPSLLAVAAGLLLGRALGPVTRFVSVRLMRGGRAVAAAGIVNAVRRPAARRVLAMVVVATALLGFCVDALVTGQHNRQNAAEQLNGAPYSLSLQRPARPADVVAALRAVDPDHRHLTPVVTTTGNGSLTAPTVAVDPRAFPRVAFFPLSSAERGDWDAILAPGVDPLVLTGTTLEGTVASHEVRLRGPARKRVDDLVVSLQVLTSDVTTELVDLSLIPLADGTTAFSTGLPCAEACTVTGIGVRAPIGSEVSGTVVLRDLTADGSPFSLGPVTAWRRVSDDLGSSVVPAADPEGNLGVLVSSEAATPPVMLSAWVPSPVPALVTGREKGVFAAPAPEGQIDLQAVGTLDRVPGSSLGSRVVDLDGVLRRPEAGDGNYAVEVWSDDARVLARAETELRKRGILPAQLTTVDDVRSELDASPAAWSLALSVLVGGASVLVAMLVMLVATATTWRARANDLAALRMAGLPSPSLRRLELLGQLPVILVGALVGSACGVVAAVLALPEVRQFTDPPAVDTTDFATPWVAVLVACGVGLVLLAGLVVVTSRWTARRARLGRMREV
ncbi:FtsX-like permease family protein [Nocardioides halotolerans]|uniref:FtsX-like permease family protein n=1 Tax=Nocardioides halotolerans TaxID=433660 RepID=UPI000407BCE2|nr:FtsX-like permease family protein [Nocardioides halotolerans]